MQERKQKEKKIELYFVLRRFAIGSLLLNSGYSNYYMIKMKTVAIGKQGRIEIPKDFRVDLDIQDGEGLVLFENGKEIIIRKQQKGASAMADSHFWHGIQEKTIEKIWDKEPEGLWESYLTEKGKKNLENLKKRNA